MSTESLESTLDDLLTDEERDDLATVLDTVRDHYPTAADAAEVLRHLEEVYLQARLSGLCREGALELVTDALSSLRTGRELEG